MSTQHSHPSPRPGPDRIALIARASLICPFIVVLIALLIRLLPPSLAVAAELLAGIVAVVGLLCAVLALTQTRRTAPAVAVQSGLGLLIGLVFVGIVLNGYFRSHPRADTESAAASEADPRTLPGPTQRITEAVAKFVSRTSELEQRLVATARPLGASPVLDLSAVESPETLISRRSMVEDYLTASLALSNHLAQAHAFLHSELTSLGAGAEEAELSATEFLKHITPQLTASLQLRELEHSYSKTLQSALDFLHQHWGHWNTHSQGTPVFDSDDFNRQYTALLQKLNELEVQDKAVKQKMASF